MEQYYQIAGLTVQMDVSGRTADLAFPYRVEGQPKADIVLDSFRKTRDFQAPKVSLDALTYVCSGQEFNLKLLPFGGLVLHASAVGMEGNAYLFSADSGVGKSTHMGLWRRRYGDEAVRVINDDKPILRLEEGRWFVYGSPWSGKYGLNHNVRYPLGGICFLTRGSENRIRPCSAEDALPLLLNSTTRPHIPAYYRQLLKLLDHLTQNASLWHLECNMDPEAAEVAYRAMSGQSEAL